MVVRFPSRSKSPLRQTAEVTALPAPIGGWNERDPITQLDRKDALVLENFIPDLTDVQLRPGYAQHATGLGAAVETLMVYAGATEKLFAAAGSVIYDATAAGAGASSLTGMTNARFEHCMFSTAGGRYLYAVNGADSARHYDGSAWAAPAITVATSSTFATVTPHQSRLWFAQKDTLDAWYLPTVSVAGAATKFPLGSVFRLGGTLLAIASWTRDGGAGMDDVLAFITDKGEVALYSGTDPASASTFSLIGVFKIPEPIGRRCWCKAGADLIILTAQGLVPLSQVLAADAAELPKIAVSDKIRDAFTRAFRGYRANFGWQVLEWPARNLILVNVPVMEGSLQHQYAMNALTGAWSKWTAVNAGCWTLFGTKPYFGGNDGLACLFGFEEDDDGAPIIGAVQHGYSQFRTPRQKAWKMARPAFTSQPGYVPFVTMLTDLSRGVSGALSSSLVTAGSLWDLAEWDVASWGEAGTPQFNWQTLSGVSPYGSLAFMLSSNSPVSYAGADVVFEPGGLM